MCLPDMVLSGEFQLWQGFILNSINVQLMFNLEWFLKNTDAFGVKAMVVKVQGGFKAVALLF